MKPTISFSSYILLVSENALVFPSSHIYILGIKTSSFPSLALFSTPHSPKLSKSYIAGISSVEYFLLPSILSICTAMYLYIFPSPP